MSDYDLNKEGTNENKGYTQNNQSGWSYQQGANQWTPPPPPTAYPGQRPTIPGQYQQQNSSEYKWNFHDYDQQGARPAPKRRGAPTGLKVFLGIIGVMLSLSIVAFAGFGIYTLAGANNILQNPGGTASEIASSAPAIKDGDATVNNGISISDVPQDEDIVSVSGALTTKQIHVKVSPSVVGIVTYQMNSTWVPAGEGSGIILSEDGYIVTNAHVISGAQGIKVVLSNSEEYEAKVIGTDARTDLAVIKIEATGLTAAALGNSDQMAAGDKVVAIGNPGGLEFAGSITQGIISAVNRQITSSGGYTMDSIQTDAAINPGNSGGALVNEYGQVIGINSSKIAATDYEGIGFAIPSNTAVPIIEDLIANGRVTGRAKIGITISGSVGEMEAQLYSVPTGVVIAGVERGSDIAAKGVQANDIITKIDGVKINTANDIYSVLEKHKPGDTITLTVFRRPVSGADQTFEVTIALFEDTGASAQVELPSIK